MESPYSLADMKAALGGEETGDNFLWWVLILFFLAGGNGFGFGGNREAVATNADLQRGFDTNSIINKLDGLSNGLCDSTYALNNSIKEGNFATQTGIANLGYQMQNCCCETNRNIDAVRYEMAKNTCDITSNANANTQRILDRLCANEVNELRDRLSLANNALAGQTLANQIVAQVRPSPVPAYQVANPYCNYNTCGCGSSLY